MKAANLALRFLLELAALAALAYWGWGVSWVLAIAAPAAWIALWATFGSPKARVKLSTPQRIVFEAIAFGAAAAALWGAGQETLAVVLFAAWAANKAALTALERRTVDV
ncbi:MAG TPA: DUF2568 domain-containing protein [Gaiellales bacterium]